MEKKIIQRKSQNILKVSNYPSSLDRNIMAWKVTQTMMNQEDLWQEMKNQLQRKERDIRDNPCCGVPACVFECVCVYACFWPGMTQAEIRLKRSWWPYLPPFPPSPPLTRDHAGDERKARTAGTGRWISVTAAEGVQRKQSILRVISVPVLSTHGWGRFARVERVQAGHGWLNFHVQDFLYWN